MFVNIREGAVSNYSELISEYVDFLSSYNGYSQWYTLDSRSDSFYGATLCIPMHDYCVDEEVHSYTLVVGDRYLNSNLFRDGVKIHDNAFCLCNVLSRVFPNAKVEFKEFDYSTLEQVYSYLLGLTEFPDRIVINGIENTYVRMSSTQTLDNYVTILLNNICNFCILNDIELHIVSTPIRETINDIAYINYISNYVYSGIDQIVNLHTFLFDFDQSLAKNYLEYFDLGLPNFNYAPRYSRKIMFIFQDMLLNDIFKLARECFFVSFMYRRVTSNTYNEFFFNNYNYMSEVFGDRTSYKGRSLRGINGRNPFRYSGEFISVGLHTSFDYRLWMCEQGGITCNKEEDTQINDINLIPWWLFKNGRPSSRKDIVVYPTTGCPWLTIADKNKSDFSIGALNKIRYYFTKDAQDSTITVRIVDGKGIKSDVWQSISFGKLSGVVDYYNKYPLYVAGGNQALSPNVWVYYQSSHVNGYYYDLSLKNPALSNSNLLFPTKMGDSNLSNVRFMGMDSKWYDIYCMEQKYEEYHYFVLAGVIYKWGVPLMPPNKDSIDIYNSGYPYGNSNKKIDIYTARDNLVGNISSAMLDRVSVFTSGASYLGKEVNKDFLHRDITGYINHCFSAWSRSLPVGIINTTDGKKFISVPNGWDGRLWHYPWWCGAIYWDNKMNDDHSPSATPKGACDFEWQLKKHNEMINVKDNYVINDRLLIDFGNSDREEILSFPAPDIDNDINYSKTIILRIVIDVLNDNSDVVFCLNSRFEGVSVSFGDGTTSKIFYNSAIGGFSHRYATKGSYIVDIINDNIQCIGDILETTSASDTYLNQADLQLRDSFIYERSAVSNISLVGSRAISVPTIKSIYFNERYCDSLSGFYSGDSAYFGVCIKHQNNLESVFLPCISDELAYKNIINLDDSSVRDIYIYGRSDSVYLVALNCATLSNIYCSSSVRRVYLSGLPRHAYDVYLYTVNAIDFYGSFDGLGSVRFHVHASVVGDLMSRYSALTFVSDLG